MLSTDDKTVLGRRKFLKMGGLAASSGALLASINAGALAQTQTHAPEIDGLNADGEPIPVGGGVPLTGWAAADGIEFRRGLEMACDEINAMGGILGRPLQPVFEDTGEQGAANVIPAMRRLIDRHGVHAIINGYNTGAVTEEYDVIADAGIIYIHHNTDIVHNTTVGNDPEKYFGIFMGDPPESLYGEGLLKFLNSLAGSGDWTPPNRKIAIVTGSQNYSMVIANAIQDNAEKYGWDVNLFETVVVPISEWGPTLAKIRNDPPACIAVTHWVPQDLAQFINQFVPNPTNSLVYMQYGPSLAAFREIGRENTNGVIYSTVIGALQDDIGQAFIERYKARFGADSSPLIGAQAYDSAHYYAISAALAGGTGGPGENEKNRLISERLRRMIYRGVMGTTHFFYPEQSAIAYPNETNDPSLGMPHQFLQIQDYTKDTALIAPPPYETASFTMPPWFKA